MPPVLIQRRCELTVNLEHVARSRLLGEGSKRGVERRWEAAEGEEEKDLKMAGPRRRSAPRTSMFNLIGEVLVEGFT